LPNINGCQYFPVYGTNLAYTGKYWLPLNLAKWPETVYRKILAAIKFGEMARNHLDKYLANLKFGDSHDQIEVIMTYVPCEHSVFTLQSNHCQIAEDGDARG